VSPSPPSSPHSTPPTSRTPTPTASPATTPTSKSGSTSKFFAGPHARESETKNNGDDKGAILYFQTDQDPVYVTGDSTVETMRKNLKSLNDAYENEFLAMSNAYSKARRELQEWIDAKEQATITILDESSKSTSGGLSQGRPRNESIISRLDVEDSEFSGEDDMDVDIGIDLPDPDFLREQLELEPDEPPTKYRKKKKGHQRRKKLVIQATTSEQKDTFLNSEKVRDQQRYIQSFGKPSVSGKVGAYNNDTLDSEANSYQLALERAY